ncbi:MAG: arsenate reductase (azurin) small subunit [Proteobacteria bacterium]|nr:arsenate reductase (azurin) small subunit [Pseudomonadota bacterium]
MSDVIQKPEVDEHEARLETDPGQSPCRISRRRFLEGAGAITVTLLVTSPWGGATRAVAATRTPYPRKRIAGLDELVTNKPIPFRYPDDNATYSNHLLIKLGEKAGGGVGKDGDVVAFSTLCTHMGGILASSYKSDSKVMGPCPTHLSTFDLTRHGMIVSGHATQSLVQVVLETDGNDIYATGLQGLVYGRSANS